VNERTDGRVDKEIIGFLNFKFDIRHRQAAWQCYSSKCARLNLALYENAAVISGGISACKHTIWKNGRRHLGLSPSYPQRPLWVRLWQTEPVRPAVANGKIFNASRAVVQSLSMRQSGTALLRCQWCVRQKTDRLQMCPRCSLKTESGLAVSVFRFDWVVWT